MTKSSNIPYATRINYRESEAELRELQTQSDNFDREVTHMTTQVRNIQKELRQAQSMATEAETSRQRAIDKAETTREELALQQPDSGRIVAYEEVIEVNTI
jgi:chromosome segregation ATPase